MKIKLVTLFLIFSLALPFAAHAATGEGETVIKVVSTFYTGYIKSLETSDRTYRWRVQPEVDPSFVSKIDALIDKAKKEDGFLGYDPILMAQDWPREKMEYATPIIKGNTAEIIAYTVWSGDKVPLCVTLASKEGAWRITDIIDMRWFEGEEAFECGGLKKAPNGKK